MQIQGSAAAHAFLVTKIQIRYAPPRQENSMPETVGADSFRSARDAAKTALRWAERREEWFTGALAKKMALDGMPISDIAEQLGLNKREAHTAVGKPLLPYAVMKGQPVDRLTAVQAANTPSPTHGDGSRFAPSATNCFPAENGR